MNSEQSLKQLMVLAWFVAVSCVTAMLVFLVQTGQYILLLHDLIAHAPALSEAVALVVSERLIGFAIILIAGLGTIAIAQAIDAIKTKPPKLG
jgi:hypothetical protein